jgi:hypothetical protein
VRIQDALFARATVLFGLKVSAAIAEWTQLSVFIDAAPQTAARAVIRAA